MIVDVVIKKLSYYPDLIRYIITPGNNFLWSYDKRAILIRKITQLPYKTYDEMSIILRECQSILISKNKEITL